MLPRLPFFVLTLVSTVLVVWLFFQERFGPGFESIWLKVVVLSVLGFSILEAILRSRPVMTATESSKAAAKPAGRSRATHSDLSHSGRPRLGGTAGMWFLVVSVVIVLIYGFILVNLSKEIGRLTTAPAYDDSVYMMQGLSLKNVLFQLPNSFSVEGFLHAPSTAFIAFLGFVLVPEGHAGPYYVNTLILLIFLGWVFAWTTKISVAWRFLILAQFLSLPITVMAVVELRPDMLWAFTLGIAFVTIFFDWSKTTKLGRYDVWCGVTIALPFLAKPTTFPMSGVVVVLSVLSVAFVSVLRMKWNLSLALSKIVRVSLVTIVCLSPLIFIEGKSYFQYFVDNVMGDNKGIWSYKGTPIEQFLYYLNGAAFDSNLGFPGTIVLILGIGALCRLWCTLGTEMRLLTVFAVATVLSVYIINSATSYKSPFLGGGFYGTMICLCLRLQILAFEKIKLTPSAKGTVLVGVVALLVYGCNWPVYSDWRPRGDASAAYVNASERFLEVWRSRRDETPGQSLTVAAAQSGPVLPDAVNIKLLQAGEEPIRFITLAFNWTPEEFVADMESADWLVTQDAGLLGSSSNLPVAAYLAEVNERLMGKGSDHQWQVFETIHIEGRRAGTVYLMERVSR